MTSTPWASAVVAGAFAGIVFGLHLQFVMGAIVMIGALVGVPTIAGGWIVHLVHAVAFGLLYGVVVSNTRLARLGHKAPSGALLGAAYGALVWSIAGSFMMPWWLNAVGAADPAVPTFDLVYLVGHLVYGIVLGVFYPLLSPLEARHRPPVRA